MMLAHRYILALFSTPWATLASSPAKRQENVLSITTPKAGDTFSLGTATDRKSLNINWTVSEAIATRPVFISLVQGNNISSLDRIETINSSTLNNGSYTWRDFSYGSPLVTSYGDGAPSGCNYSIEIKVWTDVVYSGYFTIINGEDGGLNATSLCPEPGMMLGPANETFPSSTSPDSISNGSSGSTQGTNAANTSSKSSSGVSITTLAVAIVVPVVVLLAVFALIFWFARRRGWFVKDKKISAIAAYSGQEKDSAAPAVRSDGYKGVATAEEASVGELHSDSRPLDHAGHEVHEMNGDEERSRYTVRN